MTIRIGHIRNLPRRDLEDIVRDWMEAHDDGWLPTVRVVGRQEEIRAHLAELDAD